MPKLPGNLLLLIIASALLVTFVQIQIVTIAFAKLGLSAEAAILWLVSSLAGSLVNLPLATIKVPQPDQRFGPQPLQQLLKMPTMPFSGSTLIAINVGGCLVPVGFSIWLWRHIPLGADRILIAIALVSLVCYLTSRPVPRLGIAMPLLVAPVTAALCGTLLGGEASATLAYISGTLGVLLGADLMRLREVRFLGAAVASIGGAGTFDGIFLTGVVAVLLA